MKQRKLGQNGPRVSVLGYGAMSFTDFYGPATEAGSMSVLDACVEYGITHVDTSNVYGMGRSETVIGEWLKRRGGAPPFAIATKGGITRQTDRRFNNERAHLEQALDASLTRLGVDAVDLYYLHRREPEVEIEEAEEDSVDVPAIGTIFRVRYNERWEMIDKDVEVWYFSQVVSVDKKPRGRYKVKLSFAAYGEEETVDFPNQDLQVVDTSDSRYDYAILPDGERIQAVDKDPKAEDLSVGDSVEALYQDGKEDGRWYQGRVASISHETCTIAYYDGEVSAGSLLFFAKRFLEAHIFTF